MIELLTRQENRSGLMRTVQEEYRESSGALMPKERFVQLCAAVRNDQEARQLVARGLAEGWRFRLMSYDYLDLWVPATWTPITYTMQNTVLWRAVKARRANIGD